MDDGRDVILGMAEAEGDEVVKTVTPCWLIIVGV
jgi:hypothetical protein